MRRPRRLRRVVVIGAVALAAAFGCAYLVLALLTRNPPPPPSFARPVTAGFDPSLDGRWYDPSCRLYEIVGGWLTAAHEAPVDLTRLRLAEPPLRVTIAGKEVEVTRTRRNVLRIAGGGQVVRLERRASPCVR